MKRLPIVIAVVALAGGGMASTAFAESAQDTPSTQSSRQNNAPSAQDEAAFQDARLAALHAGLELTPDQEKLWAPVDQALRDFCKFIASNRQARENQEHGRSPVEQLEKRSDALIARGRALKKIADTAGPLYATLTDAQKQRLPILLRAVRRSFMAELRHHRAWRHDEERHDEDQNQDKMEQHMRGDHMMMHHEDHDDNDESHGYDND